MQRSPLLLHARFWQVCLLLPLACAHWGGFPGRIIVKELIPSGTREAPHADPGASLRSTYPAPFIRRCLLRSTVQKGEGPEEPGAASESTVSATSWLTPAPRLDSKSNTSRRMNLTPSIAYSPILVGTGIVAVAASHNLEMKQTAYAYFHVHS